MFQAALEYDFGIPPPAPPFPADFSAESMGSGTSLGIQCLRHYASSAGGVALSPGQGTKIPLILGLAVRYQVNGLPGVHREYSLPCIIRPTLLPTHILPHLPANVGSPLPPTLSVVVEWLSWVCLGSFPLLLAPLTLPQTPDLTHLPEPI